MNDLRSAIVSSITTKPRIATWIDRLPDDVREELLAIRREWHAGLIQASARGLAISIVENCRQRGIDTCRLAGIREWLSKQD